MNFNATYVKYTLGAANLAFATFAAVTVYNNTERLAELEMQPAYRATLVAHETGMHPHVYAFANVMPQNAVEFAQTKAKISQLENKMLLGETSLGINGLAACLLIGSALASKSQNDSKSLDPLYQALTKPKI